MVQPMLDGTGSPALITLRGFVHSDGRLSHFEVEGRTYDGRLVSLKATPVPSRSVEGTALKAAAEAWMSEVRQAQEEIRSL